MARFKAAVALLVKTTLELSAAPIKFATVSRASKITRSLLTPALPLPGAAISSVAAQTSLSMTRCGLGQLVAALLRYIVFSLIKVFDVHGAEGVGCPIVPFEMVDSTPAACPAAPEIRALGTKPRDGGNVPPDPLPEG